MGSMGRTVIKWCCHFTMVLFLIALAGCGGDSSDDAPAPTLTVIEITNRVLAAVTGEPIQLQADGLFDDESTESITSRVTWSVSDEEIATISESGLLTPVSAGEIIVTAELDEVVAELTLNVLNEDIYTIEIVDPNHVFIAGKSAVQLNAEVKQVNGEVTQVTEDLKWSSSKRSVGTVSETGLFTPLRAGFVVIEVLKGEVADLLVIQVLSGRSILEALTVVDSTPLFIGDEARQLVIEGIYANGESRSVSTDLTWQSSNSAVATVDDSGVITPVASGEVSVTVTKDEMSITQVIKVLTRPTNADGSPLDKLTIQGFNLVESSDIPNLVFGTPLSISAFANYRDGSNLPLDSDITWSVDHTDIATIDASGLLTPLRTGDITVTLEYLGSTVQQQFLVADRAIDVISIIPSVTGFYPDAEIQFSAVTKYNDGSESNDAVTWTISDEEKASVSEQGLVSFKALGEVVLTASFNDIDADYSIVIEDSALVLTSIEIDTSPSPAFAGTDPIELKAMGVYADGHRTELSGVVFEVLSSDDSVLDENDQLIKKTAGTVVVKVEHEDLTQEIDLEVNVPAATLEDLGSYTYGNSTINMRFGVTDGYGQPIAGLADSEEWRQLFSVREGSIDILETVSSHAKMTAVSQLTLTESIVFVIDISARVSDSELTTLVTSLREQLIINTAPEGETPTYESQLSSQQSLALVVFDGIKDTVLELTNSGNAIAKALTAIEETIATRQGRADNTSADLHGAVIHGLSLWENEVLDSTHASGALVLVAGGADLASIENYDSALSAKAGKELFIIFDGEGATPNTLVGLACSEHEQLAGDCTTDISTENSGEASQLSSTLSDSIISDISNVLSNKGESQYLLEYISPKRSGDQSVVLTYHDESLIPPTLTASYSANNFSGTVAELAISGSRNVALGSNGNLSASTLWSNSEGQYEWLLTAGDAIQLTGTKMNPDLEDDPTIVGNQIGISGLSYGEATIQIEDLNNVSVGGAAVGIDLSINVTDTIVTSSRKIIPLNTPVALNASTHAAESGSYHWTVSEHCELRAEVAGSAVTEVIDQSVVWVVGATAFQGCVVEVVDIINGNAKFVYDLLVEGPGPTLSLQ